MCTEPNSGCGSMVLFIHNQDKLKEWILPKVNIKLFNRVKASFAQHFGVGKHKRIVLAMDRRAGWRCAVSK